MCLVTSAWSLLVTQGTLDAMNEGSQLDLPSGPFTRPFHITMALFQLHQSIKMKRCRSICVNSGFFSKKIFVHVNGTYRLKNHVCMLNSNPTSSIKIMQHFLLPSKTFYNLKDPFSNDENSINKGECRLFTTIF